MDQALPDKPALIAVLLVERPTCLDCISQKAGVSTIEADRCLTVIGTALELWRSHDRCQTCGQKRAVYSLIRSSNRRMPGHLFPRLDVHLVELERAGNRLTSAVSQPGGRAR